jgi:uncharacterized protein
MKQVTLIKKSPPKTNWRSLQNLQKRYFQEAQTVALQLAQFPEVTKIILHGSLARGEVRAFSDIDLIVIGNFQQRFIERMQYLRDNLKSSLAVDILAYTPGEFKAMKSTSGLVQFALKEGQILYESRKRKKSS